MLRKIIEINEELCNGCGLCAEACHEAAIAIVNGKARLIRDDYCDGLGNCLPVCPEGAISFVEREALPYNEEEVSKAILGNNLLKNDTNKSGTSDDSMSPAFSGGCPGTRLQNIHREECGPRVSQEVRSQLRQWPVQIQLVPVNAPYFKGADLLIAADCSAYAYGDIHSFMSNKITLIGCPKLDDADYAGKLSDILAANDIKSITIIRMEVPCCGGIVHAVQTAMKNTGRLIPWRVITISADGAVIEDRG